MNHETTIKRESRGTRPARIFIDEAYNLHGDAVDAFALVFAGIKWRKQYDSLPWYKKILQKFFWKDITRLFKKYL